MRPGRTQLTCKIVDPDVNGGLRYKGWTHHRDSVLERLGGWMLIAHGPDFATFNIPQVGVILSVCAVRHSALCVRSLQQATGCVRVPAPPTLHH